MNMKIRVRRFLIPLLAALGLIFVFLTGVAADRYFLAGPDPQDPAASVPNFPLVQEAWDMINRVYVDRSALQSKALTYGAISGMVNALGDTGHSTFLTPEMVRDEKSFMQGEYVGVGIQIEMKNGQVVIVAPLDNSPAERAGVRPGEQIVKVNGESTAEATIDQVVQHIVGPAGTSVVLTLFDPRSQSTTDVTLTRARIAVENVSWQPIPGFPYADIRIAAFSSGVSRELENALQQIQAQKYAGAILDLRNDPGGELAEAVGVASQFLKAGNVLLEKDSKGVTHAIPIRPDGAALSIPLVVLINGGTASAAEIVAGAIQDAKRAPLVGETTFGTGTVLQLFRLSDGSELMLATREWLTPLGRTIWHKGIAPDISLVLPTGADLVTPQLMKQMTEAQMKSNGDLQVLKAIDLLSKPAGS
jgi:carboxyl-terminal processing protease